MPPGPAVTSRLGVRRPSGASDTPFVALAQRWSGSRPPIGRDASRGPGPAGSAALGGLPKPAAVGIAPNTDIDAHELIDASEAVTSQLDGLRGLPSLDRDALRDLVLPFRARAP
jgi:hypothetical protein